MKQFATYLILALALSACWSEPEGPSYEAPERLVEAMKQRRAVSDVLPTISPAPKLVATATASTGQSMALYEYRPTPQPEASDVFVSLRFANDTLVSVGHRQRHHPTTAFGEWLRALFPDDDFDDPYGEDRVRDCIEALEATVRIQEPGHASSSSRTC
jgi:hypothetical protein